MVQKLPDIRNLQAFESAGRLGSYKAAAMEINVTASAISHRISSLEAFLGETLFEAHGRGMALSVSGRSYLMSIQKVFDQLNAATEQLKYQGVAGPLTIRVYPTFAHRWLFPKLPSFSEEYEDVELNIVVTQTPLDFSSPQTDVAIEYMQHPLTGYECEMLMEEEVVVVCSPQYMLTKGGPSTPADLGMHTLIHSTMRPKQWQWWLEEAGFHNVRQGWQVRVSNRDSAIDAAAAGLGLALGHKPLIDGALIRNRVVMPFDHSVMSDFRYYFVTTAERACIPRVAAFRDWVLSKIQKG